MVGTWGVGVFKENKQVCGVSIRLHYLSTNLHSFSKDRSDFIMGSCISFLIALVYFLGRLSFGVACAGPALCYAILFQTIQTTQSLNFYLGPLHAILPQEKTNKSNHSQHISQPGNQQFLRSEP